MAWVFALIVLLLAPIVWALTKGRGGSVPPTEDQLGSTGYGVAMRDRDKGTLPR